jgi:hypothetical protein
MRSLLIASLCGVCACSETADRTPVARRGEDAAVRDAGGTPRQADNGPAIDGPNQAGSPSVRTPDVDAGTVTQSCAKQSAQATQQPVFLEFAFDVSGSMGKGDKPWHDRALKWDPVVAATKAFFEDPQSKGFSAALTFFPADGGEDARCERASYLEPDVPMQALPSNEFGAALTAIGEQDWRGGTPTLSVVQGVFDQIAAQQMTQPGRYALVLVTDGHPQDCDDDEISSVAELVRTMAAEIPSYVIGVTNPPIDDAPDVTSNLSEIAKAGGTGDAYLIDTGDPTQTVADFKRTIDGIRNAAVSCELAIPEAPAGRSFDKQKVSVRYASGATQTPLTYDAACKAQSSWHYDDSNAPKQIVLCPDTCRALQGDEKAELAVDFECEPVILL